MIRDNAMAFRVESCNEAVVVWESKGGEGRFEVFGIGTSVHYMCKIWSQAFVLKIGWRTAVDGE